MAKFLSEEQRTLLTAALDRLIPAAGAMPSAGGTRAAEYIDGAAAGSPRMARLFAAGLRALELAAARKGASFVDLSDDERDDILRGMEANKPAFFETLLAHAYNGYYTDPSVIVALGLEARPPQPRGYVVERGDLSSLAAVVARGKAYREA